MAPSSAQKTAAAHNPFATRYVAPGKILFCNSSKTFVKNVLKRWQASGNLGQIVGPHGSGKTTLACHLASHSGQFESFAHVTIRNRKQIGTRFSVVDTTRSNRPNLLIVDGIERLSWLHRWALIRNCHQSKVGLILTTHKPQPWIRTITTLEPSLETFGSIVKSIAPNHSIPIVELETAFQKSGGNIRESLMLLYDYWERQR